MSTSCPLCFENINGDAQFVQFHVEHCLDSPKAEPITSSRPEEGNEAEDSDAAFARQLLHDEQQERDEVIVAQLSDEREGQNGGKKRRVPEQTLSSCPGCNRNWEELEVTEAERNSHVTECILNPVDRSSDDGEMVQAETRSNRFLLGKAGNGSVVSTVEHIIPLIAPLLERSHSQGKTKASLLAVDEVAYVRSQLTDWGWGCGYRNAQMLFSSLRHLDCYSELACDDRSKLPPIPTITELQIIIENAWKRGHDPPGAAHFKNKLVGSKKWIGTTEIYTAFTALGIRARVVDFPKVKGGDGTHAILVRWIVNYFSDSRSDYEEPSDAFAILSSSNGSAVKRTTKQPLYLQHQGHSRTVVGVDQGKGGNWLLMFDCGKSINAAVKTASTQFNSTPSPPKRFKRDSNSPPAGSSKYGAFFDQVPGEKKIWGSLGGGGSGVKKGELDVNGYSKILEGYRVSLANLSKRDEYQILYVEEGPILSDSQVTVRKIVASTRIEK